MKRRRPILALLVDMLAAPLGHLYVGAPVRGLVLTVAALLVGLLGIVSGLRGVASFPVMCLVVIVAALVPPIDAYVLARRVGPSYRLKSYNRWFAYLGAFVVLAGAGELLSREVRHDVVEGYKIPAASMVPTLQVGDRILADKMVYRSDAPQRGDIVVFESPQDATRTYVKRVIGLPGETIEIRDRNVWINGSELQEPYAVHTETKIEPGKIRDQLRPIRVPDGSYFMMGDNREHSHDSRFWGPVARDKIWGRVRTIYFSWAVETLSVRWDRIGMALD